MGSCELNQIFRGEVASVQNYGAFVRIPGSSQQGLIHRSQVSSTYVDDVADVLQRGERVWCKVINVDENGKIGLSMKHVHQGSGTDLDPNGVQLQQDEQRRKAVSTTNNKKVIELQAVYNTTCTKCGIKGHLAKDCFTTPDGKKYELLPDVDEEETVAPTATEPEVKSKEKKSKLKKHKRKKSKNKDNSDSDDSESREEIRKRKKKCKEHKKKKRRRSSSSESETSQDSVYSSENKKHSKKCKHSRSRHSD